MRFARMIASAEESFTELSRSSRRANTRSQSFTTVKCISEETMMSFLNQLTDGCFQLIDEMPELLDRVSRIALTIFERDESSRKPFVDRLLKLIVSSVTVSA